MRLEEVTSESERKRLEEEAAEAERKRLEEEATEAERKSLEEEAAEAERKLEEEVAEAERKRLEEEADEAERKRQEEEATEVERKRQMEAAVAIAASTTTDAPSEVVSSIEPTQTSSQNLETQSSIPRKLGSSTDVSVLSTLFVHENETTAQPTTTYKIIIIGNSGVGKTAYLHRFLNNSYTQNHQATVNVADLAKTYNIKGQNIKFQLWDTAGQERYLSMTRNYFRSAVGVILVYDCTRLESFNRLSFWFDEVRASDISNEAVLMLIGCKADQELAVPTSQAQEFAERNNMLFFETSSSTGEHVHESMGHLFMRVYQTVHLTQSNSVTLNQPKGKDNIGCAC